MTPSARDPLTEALLYPSYAERLEALLEEAKQQGAPLSLALVDVDWFQRINAEHGAEAGDAMLQELAEHLRSSCGEEAEVCRYGGDAFLVVAPGEEKEQTFLKLERARAAFDGEHVAGAGGTEISLRLTISAGLAACPDDGDAVSGLLRKAMDALYRAKAGRRNKVCLAREEKMVTKTTHYTQGQLEGLSRLAQREGISEAVLLREALDDLLRKRNS
jgi:diguanylate cyclase (GGDEF)-like protein